MWTPHVCLRGKTVGKEGLSVYVVQFKQDFWKLNYLPREKYDEGAPTLKFAWNATFKSSFINLIDFPIPFLALKPPT